MDICSADPEFEAALRKVNGPKNESTYDTLQRLYEGSSETIYKPLRADYTFGEIIEEGFDVSSFNLKVTPAGPEKGWKKKLKHAREPLTLACHYYEPELEGELAIFGEEVASVHGEEDDDDEGDNEMKKGGEDKVGLDNLVKDDDFGEEEEEEEDEEDDPGIGLKSVSSAMALDALLLQKEKEEAGGGSRNGEVDDETDIFVEDTIIVYLHTNTANSMQAKEILPLCKRINTPMVCYDLRGHGKSCGEGIVDMATQIRDLSSVIQWAQSRKRRVLLWSRGLSNCISIAYMHSYRKQEEPIQAEEEKSYFMFSSKPKKKKDKKGMVADLPPGTPVKYMVFDSPFLSMEQILEDAVDKIHNDGYTYIPRKVFDLLTTFFRSGIRDRVQGMDPFDIRPEKQIGDITVPGCFLVPTNDDYINCANGYHMASMYGGMHFARIFEGSHFSVRTPDMVLGTATHIYSHIKD